MQEEMHGILRIDPEQARKQVRQKLQTTPERTLQQGTPVNRARDPSANVTPIRRTEPLQFAVRRRDSENRVELFFPTPVTLLALSAAEARRLSVKLRQLADEIAGVKPRRRKRGRK